MNNTLDEKWRIVAYLDGLPPSLRFWDLRQAKVNAFPFAAKRLGDDVRELQSQSQEELDALLPSAEGATAGRAFNGKL